MNTLDLTRTTAEDNQLVELVEEITARLQAGEPCDVDEYAARYPKYADRLRGWMTVMSAMADLGHSLAMSSGATAGLSSSAILRPSRDPAHSESRIQNPVTTSPPPLTGEGLGQGATPSTGLLGDFRILRELGRGGMGVVYEAEQISLGRRVALKVLPFAAMLDRQQLARFKNEARAAATLDHSNIVAIYSVGAERGVHYYAMQLIEGQSLAQVVEQLRTARLPLPPGEGRGEGEQRGATSDKVCPPPLHGEGRGEGSSDPVGRGSPDTVRDTAPIANLTTLHAPSSSLPAFGTREYFRTIAQLGIQAAEALDHAHQNGVLHRDIKPANLLVDDAGKLWITDFGLARMEQDAGMTMTGDLLGTLRYMSPEQALAKRVVVDHRSDVYSLGVTLYELLSLEPAYAATDRQELLHQIAFDDPRPPRQINPVIPADLETIVLKAMRKDPEHRYATAHDLADDLQRFLDDQPIKAKPPTSREHVVRWARRHPAAVWAAVLFLSTTAIISTASALLIAGAYNRASTETAKATAVSDLLREMLATSNPDQVKGSGYLVRDMFDEFSARLGDQLAGEPEVEADIQSVIGKSYWRLGVYDRAELHLKKALDLRRQLYGSNDERVADSLVDYAWNLSEQERNVEAEKHVRDGLSIYDEQNSDPHRTVRAHWALQQFLNRQSRYDQAEVVANEALALAGDGNDSDFAEIPNILHALAEAKSTEEKYDEAEKCARKAVELHRRLHGDHHPETAYGLSALGTALRGQQKFADAEPPLREALAIFREYYTSEHHSIQSVTQELNLVLKAKGDRAALEAFASDEAEQERRSDNPGYDLRVAGLLLTENSLGGARKVEGRRLIRRAIETYSQVAVDHPEDLNRRLIAAEGYLKVATICALKPDLAGVVEDAFGRLTTELNDLLADFPKSSHCQWQCAMLYRRWAFAVEGPGNYMAQEEHAYREAVQLLEKHTRTAPDPFNWFWLANTHAYLGDVLVRSARLDEAGAAFRKAMQIYDDHAAELVDYPITEVAHDQTRFAYFLVTTQREKEAADVLHNATLAVQREPNPIESAQALAGLAIVRLRLGDEAGYREACAKLVQLPFRLPNDDDNLSRIRICGLGPDAVEDPTLLVKLAEDFAAHNSHGTPYLDHVMLGTAHFRAGHYEQAERHLEESVAQFPSDAPQSLPPEQIMPRLLLAMTKWQLGEQDEARRMLRELQPHIDQGLRSPSTFWDRRAVLEIRRSEAEAMIKPKDAGEAVENKEGPDKESSSNSLNKHQRRGTLITANSR